MVRSLLDDELFSYEVLCDEQMDIRLRDDDRNYACWMKGHCQQRDCSCSASLQSTSKYYCLQVGMTKDFRTYGKRFWWLLLEKKTTANNTYQRVGLGYIQLLRRSFHLFRRGKSYTITII
jgi:hypothetical protein